MRKLGHHSSDVIRFSDPAQSDIESDEPAATSYDECDLLRGNHHPQLICRMLDIG